MKETAKQKVINEIMGEVANTEIQYNEIISNLDEYISHIDLLYKTIKDFKQYCENAKTQNVNIYNSHINYIQSNVPDDTDEDSHRFWRPHEYEYLQHIKGTHYLSHVKRYIHTFEGVSKLFREKL